MGAVPPLARTLRYGDVRGTDVSALRTVTEGLLVRICVGLPGAVASLSDEAAAALRTHIDAVHSSLGLLDQAEMRERWLDTLGGLAASDQIHGLVTGRLTRLLYDAGRLDVAETRRRMGLVLTAGTPPAHAAHWVEGFLAGGGLLLVHDAALLSLVDEWLSAVATDSFTDVLPLLRRTFGTFAPPERRSIGERVRGGVSADEPAAVRLDQERAALVLPTLSTLLGREIRHG
jgi:hypothetical protein